MADNPFDVFDSEEGEPLIAPAVSSGINPFDAYDTDEGARAPAPAASSLPQPDAAPYSLPSAPGVSFQKQEEDPEIKGLLTELDARNKKASKDALDKARGDSFLEGVSDPQQYLEAGKGIVPGAVRFGGTTLKGGAAIQSAPGLAYDKVLRERLAVMDSIDAGERLKLDKLGKNDPHNRAYWTASEADRKVMRAEIERQVAEYKPTPVQERALFKAGEAVTEFSKGILPPAPGYEDSVGRNIGEGLGSLVAGLPMGFLGRIPAATFFGAGGSGEALDRAVEFDKQQRAAGRAGLTEEQKVTAALWGVAPGTTDLLPVEFLLGRLKIPAPLTSTVARVVGRIGGQAFVEGMQESGQAFLQNAIAQEVYNPQQKLLEGIATEGGYGAGVGGISQAAKELAQVAIKNFAARRARNAPFPGDTLAPAAQPQTIEDAAKLIDAAQAPEAESQPTAELFQPRVSRPTEGQGVDVIQYIRAKGGLKPSGELAAVNAERYPGLVRESGLEADKMREALVEAGYLEESGPDQPAVTTPQDVYDLIGRQISGERVFPVADQAGVLTRNQQQSSHEFDRELQAAEQNFVLPEIAKLDSEVGSPVIRSAYARLSNDEKAETIERFWRSGEDISDVIEEIAIRNEDAPSIAAMAIRRVTQPEQVAEVRQVVAERAPELLADFDGAVASLGLDRPSTVTASDIAELVGEPEAVPAQTPANLRQSFANIIDSKASLGKAAESLGVSEEDLAPLVEEAVQKGWLRRDGAGKLRRAPKTARTGNIAALAIADAAPEALPGEGNVAKTDAAADRWDAVKAAVRKSAAKILPADVRIDFVDSIEIARLRKEDELMALRAMRENTQTPEFKTWFGDSKVVDADGNPLVVYHGTINDIEVFDIEKFGRTDMGHLGRGFYFSDIADQARAYAGMAGFAQDGRMHIPGFGMPQDGVIYPVYLKIENPYYTVAGSLRNEANEAGISVADFVEQLRREGYDGVITTYRDVLNESTGEKLFGPDRSEEYVAFDPTQIKSIFSQVFDPSDPRIAYALRTGRGQTESENSAMLEAEQEGVSDDRSAEDGAIAGREGVEAVAAGAEAGIPAGASEGVPGAGTQGADARILRAESGTYRADGSVIAGRLSRTAERDVPGASDAGAVLEVGDTEEFSIGGFSGRVTAEEVLTEKHLRNAGIPLHRRRLARLTYRVYASDAEVPTGKRVAFKKVAAPLLAQAKIAQHPDGTWEVSMVEVNPEIKRKGLASTLYAAIEDDLGIRMSPSGVLTEDGYKFWQRRSPASVQWHQWSSVDQVYVSPNWIDTRIDDLKLEINQIQRKAIIRPLDELDLRSARSEIKRLIAIWQELPEEARARKVLDSMFALRAFHGSPHDFDRFSLNRIGTGEGAQVFGHGLYFAENELVAKQYQSNVSIMQASGDRVASRVQRVLEIAKSIDQAKDMLQQRMEASQHASDRAIFKEALERFDEIATKLRGNLYEVEIDVEPEDLLDWDLPLSEQSEKIQVALKPLLDRVAAQRSASIDPVERRVARQILSGEMTGGQLMRALGVENAKASQALREAGVPGIRFLDQGSRDAGEGSRNIVIFDDSLVTITKKNGQPVTAQERADVIEQMHQEQGGGDAMLALRGFYSPAIRAAEGISQQKGTGEQFWKQITKVPGVRKDELEWMGLEEFLADKKSITKAEVLEFMRAHQVELDEKILGTSEGIAGDVATTPVTIDRLRQVMRMDEDELPDAYTDIQELALDGRRVYIASSAERREGQINDWVFVEPGEEPLLAQNRAEAVHMAEGILRSGNDGETRFEGHKVPGGSNYRELLIRLPELARTVDPAAQRRMAEIQSRIDELVQTDSLTGRETVKSGFEDEVNSLRAEYNSLLLKGGDTPRYVSKHFQDQEIVHLRVDDRTGPNGEKVLFINEVQSDLHQKGRTTSYGLSEDQRFERRRAIDKELDEVEFRLAHAQAGGNYSSERAVELRKQKEQLRNRRQALSEEGVPDAPFKGDLWLELALKRALLYASENGYDAVSWARSDQIGPAVGQDPAKLALHYDQKIGRFLDKYTAKWGGKVEAVSGVVVDPTTPKRSSLDIIAQATGIDPSSIDRIEADSARAAALPNQLIRITPEMRASVLEGQPLAVRRQPQQAAQPEALGRTDPYNAVISIAMRAIEAEAASKGKKTEQEAVRVLRHEAVEFFKANNFFMPKEWQLLEKTARQKGWVETTGVRQAYESLYKSGMPEADLNQILIKEAIAEQYSEFHLGRKQFTPAITRIFQRIKDYLRRITNWMKGQGFQTWEDVFTKIDEGEFKRRFEAAFPSEQQAQQGGIAPMALPGMAQSLPLSPAPPAATAGTTAAPRSLVDIQKELRRRLGLTVAKGRMDQALSRQVSAAGGKLMGQFDRDTEVIRLRVLQDIDTEAHEVAHALENRYQSLAALQNANAAELNAFAALVNQSGVSEGFAEFFRLYLTNPQAAQAHAPVFYKEFEDFFDTEDPQTLADIQDIRDQYQQWRNASSAGRITAAVKSGVPTSTWEDIRKEHAQGGLASVGGMFWRYLEKVYQGRIDRTNPIRKLMMQIARQAEANNQTLDLTAWKNPQMQAQKISSFDAAGYLDIVRGVHWENSVGRGKVNLRDALATAFGGTAYEQWTDDQRDAFGAYLIARRGRWLWQRFEMDPALNRGRLANPPQNPQNGDWYYDTMQRKRRVFLNQRWEDELTHAPDKHTRADHDMTVAELQKANPQFPRAAAMVYEFNRDVALKRYQAGLDTREEYDHKVMSPDYVPWFRDMTDQLFAGTALSGRKVAAKFKLKGSYRDFINPVEGIIRQVFDTNFEIAVNKPKLLLAQMADTVKGAGRYAEIIPATRMKVEEVRIREALENAGREQGLPPQDVKQMVSAVAAMIGDNAVAKLFKSDKAGDGGDAILHYMDGGELKMLQIHDDGHGIARDILGFFDAVRGTPFGDSLFNMVVGAVRVPQKAITSTFAFLYRNLIRDTMQASVLVAGYFPVVSNVRTVLANRAMRKAGQETWSEILARHGGIMGGIGRTDVQAVREGRVYDLRTQGVTLKPWAREFWTQTVNPWHEDFWKWAEWSESNARQTVARISFQRAFADVKRTYPSMPAEQQNFVALEAAVQKSRDYTDYGRMGDFPSQIVFNRLVMFLNPALQGPDKMIRALLLSQTNEGKFAAAQAVRKKLMPLLSDQYQSKPLTDSEVAALKDSMRMWVTIAIIASAHLALEYALNSPEELEDKSELERALNVTFTINGQPYRIPRGFDIINVASNFVRASYDSWAKEDPTAWERFRETLAMSLLPPASSPILDLYIGYKHNRNNFFGSDIVPDYMVGRMPEDRYTAYTSNLSKEIAEAVNTVTPFEVSPIMVEYSMNAIGSEWARDILRAYDTLDPEKPALRWQEYPFVRAARGLRGSRGGSDYWELMGKEGEFMQPAGSYKSEVVDNKVWTQDEIRRFFDVRVKDDDAKAYAILNAHYERDERLLHPMERAKTMVTAVSATMRDVAANRVDVPLTRKKTERAEVSRAVRGYAMEILTEINRREFLNALIALQRPGYEKREPQPVQPYIEELKTISPEIWTVLRERIVTGDHDAPSVYDYETVREAWPELRRQLLDRDKREEIIEQRGQVKFKDLRSYVGAARSGGIR